MALKLIPIVGAAGAGALVAFVTSLLGLGSFATVVVAALVLSAVVLIGTPLAFGVPPFGWARRPRDRDVATG